MFLKDITRPAWEGDLQLNRSRMTSIQHQAQHKKSNLLTLCSDATDLQPVTNQLRSHLDAPITDFNITMIKKELIFMNQRYLQLPHGLA